MISYSNETGFQPKLTRGFESINFGTRNEIEVVLLNNEKYSRINAFGHLRFEKDTYFEFANKDKIYLEFHNKKEGRLIRHDYNFSNLSKVQTALFYLHKSAGEDNRAQLIVIKAAMSLNISENIPILFSPEFINNVEESRSDNLNDILNKISLKAANNCYLLRESPNFLGDRTSDVRFLLSNNTFLVSEIKQSKNGNYFIFAKEVQYNAVKNVPRIIIAKYPSIKIIKNEEDAWLNGLSALDIKSSPLIIAWQRYHQIKSEEAERIFNLRRDNRLIFDRIADEDGYLVFSINNWKNIEVKWREGTKKEKEFYYYDEFSVEIKSSDTDSGFIGKLHKISYDGKAYLKAERIPPDKGIICAYQQGTFSIQDDRQKNALSNLESGNTGLSTLLDILNNPSTAATCKPYDLKTRKDDLNASQLDAVKKAKGNQSIMVIKGPPGTGKTKVIAKIIEELVRENHDQNKIRILVSSTQNAAVMNVSLRLQNLNILNYEIKSQFQTDEKEKEEKSNDFRRNQLRISNNLRVKENLLKYKTRWEFLDKIEDLFDRDDVHDDELYLLRKIVASDDDFIRYGNELFDLKKRIQDIINNIEAEVNANKKRSISESILPRLEEMIQYLRNIDQYSAELTSILQLSETLFSENELEYLYEKTINVSRKYARYKINENQLSSLKKTISELIVDYESQTRIIKNKTLVGKYSFKNYRNFREQLISEIEAVKKDFINEKEGILFEWMQILENTPKLWENWVSKYSDMVTATCQMSSKSNVSNSSDFYDYVIIDEAARADLLDLLIPLTLGRRILMVGDQNQLPPFVEESILNKAAERKSVDLSILTKETIFGELFDNLPTENKVFLDTQYRSNPIIGKAFSKAFYNYELESGYKVYEPQYDKWKNSKEPGWGLFDNYPLVWVDSSSLSKNKIYTENNPEETKIVIKLLQKLDMNSLNTDLSMDVSTYEPIQNYIGIICFYNSQKSSIEVSIHNNAFTNKFWEVGVVDSFQGKEFPLIIMVCSRHNIHRGDVGFLHLQNRINVAVSRAQKQLIIIGSYPTINHKTAGSKPFKEYLNNDEIHIVSAEEVINGSF